MSVFELGRQRLSNMDIVTVSQRKASITSVAGGIIDNCLPDGRSVCYNSPKEDGKFHFYAPISKCTITILTMKSQAKKKSIV